MFSDLFFLFKLFCVFGLLSFVGSRFTFSSCFGASGCLGPWRSCLAWSPQKNYVGFLCSQSLELLDKDVFLPFMLTMVSIKTPVIPRINATECTVSIAASSSKALVVSPY